MNPWNLYLAFGDKDILEKQYDSMKGWINFMRSHSRNNLWNYRLQFGGWEALEAEEGSYFGVTSLDLTCTAYYAYSTEILAEVVQILGKEEDYKEYSRLCDSIKHTFEEQFFETDGRMMANTQTAYIIALHFGLTPEKYKAKAVGAC